jgi:hypothetical protein
MPAGVGASMLIVGFILGRLTAPTPTSEARTASEHAPAEVGAPLTIAAATAATAAPPAANDTTNAPQAAANPSDPAPGDNPTTSAQGNTAPNKGGRLAGAARPGPAARRGEPSAPAPPVDPLVQAVKQSISEDQARPK